MVLLHAKDNRDLGDWKSWANMYEIHQPLHYRLHKMME